jgi:hypothetical protein
MTSHHLHQKTEGSVSARRILVTTFVRKYLKWLQTIIHGEREMDSRRFDIQGRNSASLLRHSALAALFIYNLTP